MIYILMIFNDPSEIILICWFGAEETICITIIVETVVLINMFWKWWSKE